MSPLHLEEAQETGTYNKMDGCHFQNSDNSFFQYNHGIQSFDHEEASQDRLYYHR